MSLSGTSGASQPGLEGGREPDRDPGWQRGRTGGGWAVAVGWRVGCWGLTRDRAPALAGVFTS